MAERPMEHFTVDGVNIFEITDAKARQDCSDLKDETRNLLNIYKWSSPNNTMTVNNGIASNIVTDTRSLILYVVLWNNGSVAQNVYSAAETVRHKKITFTASSYADTVRFTASGDVIDLVVEFSDIEIVSGTTYTISFDITGDNNSVVGGLKITNIQIETGTEETAYIPHISAKDLIVRERLNNAEENIPYITDGEYSSRYLLTATDYLTKQGKYIGTTGIEADSANHVASDYIRVHEGDEISYTLRGSNNSVSVVYMYDSNKTPFAQVALATAYNQDVTGTYTAPINGYIRISNRVDFDSPVLQIGDGGKLLGIKKLIIDYIANTEEYPSYWNTAIENAISAYYVKSALVADHGVSFAYVTDTHWAFNAKNSSKLISHICEKTNLNMAVHGGDFTRYGTDDIYGFMAYLDKGITFLPVIGNHEYDSTLTMTTSEVYAYAFKQSETIFTHQVEFNYCYDNNAQKVRFITLNYNDPNCLTYLENWTTELSAVWSVIVLSHMYWDGALRGNTPTVTQIGSDIADKIDELNNTINAEIILLLVGHVHRDMDTTTFGGVPIVSTNCDAYADSQSYDWGGYKMYADDTTSQCIDLVNIDTTNRKIYMTRLGVGLDRQFNY